MTSAVKDKPVAPTATFEHLPDIIKAHGADYMIQLPSGTGFHSSMNSIQLTTLLPVWVLDQSEPALVGTIAMKMVRPHIDNRMSRAALLRSHGPSELVAAPEGAQTRTFFLVPRTHSRYGFNVCQPGQMLPPGISQEDLYVGLNVLARFTDKTDREALIIKVPFGSVQSYEETPVRALIQSDDCVVEVALAFDQIVKLLQPVRLSVL